MESFTDHGRGALWALLLGLAVWNSPVCAGEPAATPPPEEKKTVDEPPWRFDPADRRDPFTFTKAIAAVDPVNPTPDGTGTASGRPVLRPHEVEAKKKEAEGFYQEAERLLMDSDPAQAVLRCDRGLEVFKDISNIADYRELQEVREKLFRMRKAADRMRQRQDAEREFARLNIRVTGVIARDKRSQAIVNAAIVSKGDLVQTSGESSDVVVVEDILPEQVIFVFRGYRMMLTLSEIGR